MVSLERGNRYNIFKLICSLIKIHWFIESYAVEFDGKSPGLITYKFPSDKQPDTKVSIKINYDKQGQFRSSI